MNMVRTNEQIYESMDEYLIFVGQNKELIEILLEIDIISQTEGEHLIDSVAHLKRNLEITKAQLIKRRDINEKICDGYRILNILMDLKDIDDRVFEILENKLQFPMDEGRKKLLEYFTCDAGIRLLFNTKTRYRLNTFIFDLCSIKAIKT